MIVKPPTRSFALADIGQCQCVILRHIDVVTDGGVAAGRPHGAGEPGIFDLEIARLNQKKPRFAAGHAADDDPAAVIDAAGERKFT
jgi:hypothetical protein